MLEIKVTDADGQKQFNIKTDGDIGEIFEDTALAINQLYKKLVSADEKAAKVFAKSLTDNIDEIVYNYERFSERLSEDKLPGYHIRYSVPLSVDDVEDAMIAFQKGNYGLNFIDPLRFEVVRTYLAYFPKGKHITTEILNKDHIHRIVNADDVLKCMCPDPERMIPECFDEVCDFIGSIVD